ncbi:MAG: tripartite tricarboxylate transporter substrate binding protein [Treponema sp.]|jgi:tripartite-type tricarboxylate transporter receptor subunit TctC|nr:tripartite tricarboxylate transporter substrate binding protein [Treponema sp.]
MKRLVSLVALILIGTLAFAEGAKESGGGAAAYPAKTIQVYIPWGAGGDTDLHGRTLSELIGKELGVSVVCTNMPGTGGTVAARQVLNSAKDGYTVLWSQTSFLISSALGIADFSYRDMETVATVIEDDSNLYVMSRKSAGKFKTIQEYIAYGKAHPNAVNDGIEVGTDAHLTSLIFGDSTGVPVTRIDVGGTNTKIPALINGDVDIGQGVYGTYKAYFDSGDLVPLVMLGTRKLADLPNIPTLKEATGADFNYTKIFGYWMPPGTDKAIVDKFAAAARKAVNSDAFKAHCEKYFITPSARTGSEAKAFLDKQYDTILKYKDAMVVK